MSKKRREIAAANNNYIKHQIITHNRRRWRTLHRNMPKYTIDRDTRFARRCDHGKRSARAIEARMINGLRAYGYTEAQIERSIELHQWKP